MGALVAIILVVDSTHTDFYMVFGEKRKRGDVTVASRGRRIGETRTRRYDTRWDPHRMRVVIIQRGIPVDTAYRTLRVGKETWTTTMLGPARAVGEGAE